ncbi:MAG: hypothetical protein IJT12_09165 [Paludibacteraceae bacterium]|nr:hypothetical protein [Paludibacteraceae bacterium]
MKRLDERQKTAALKDKRPQQAAQSGKSGAPDSAIQSAGSQKGGDWKLSNRAFWGMVKKCGLSEDDAHALIATSYPGRVSTTELHADEINVLVRALHDHCMPEMEKTKETWRRLLTGVVRQWCQLNGYRTDFEYVSKVASRGERHISQMSVTDLQARYYKFLKMIREWMERPAPGPSLGNPTGGRGVNSTEGTERIDN